MNLGEKEKLNLWGMKHWFETDVHTVMQELRQSLSDLLASGDSDHLNRSLANIKQLKSIFQRVHNYNHMLALLAAKSFLESESPNLPWAEIQFSDDPNARGPDILIKRDGVRIIGAVKTTEPCGRSKSGLIPTKFGSNQKEEIRKDLETLRSDAYDGYARYMFVTSPLAFQILKEDFRREFSNVTFVLLAGRFEVSRAGG